MLPLPDMVNVDDRVAASAAASVPLMVVADPDADMVTGPPPTVSVPVVVANKLCAFATVPDKTALFPDMVSVDDSVAASAAVRVPLMVVAVPVAERVTAPPPMVTVPVVVENKFCASVVVPDKMLPSPDMVNVDDRVAASAVVRVPLMVVAVPVAERVTGPPPTVSVPVVVANKLWAFATVPDNTALFPDMVKVDDSVAASTAESVPLMVVAVPVAERVTAPPPMVTVPVVVENKF